MRLAKQRWDCTTYQTRILEEECKKKEEKESRPKGPEGKETKEKDKKRKRERKIRNLASYARRREDKNQPLANANRCKKWDSFVMKFSRRRRWGCADDQDGVLLPGVAPARSGMNSEKKASR
jgi:hypothetical protein